MRVSKRTLRFRPRTQRAAAFVSLLAMTLSLFAPALLANGAQKSNKQARRLTEEQRIVHVLNRLGFGARPGDIERVKTMGIENYINLQLNPEKISDEVADSKVKNIDSLTMSTAELYEKYPQPGQLLKQLQAKGVLPNDLEQARENRVKGTAVKPGEAMPAEGETKSDTADAVKKSTTPQPPVNPLENEKYRQAVRDYYLQNGLQQPQKLTTDLQASRILRAVYSERQLQEVMVDFWTNHFNVFAGKGADRWLLTAYDRDTIRPNAMGKFLTLLTATAESPAMLFYLDNFQSVSPNPQRGAGGGARPVPPGFRPLSPELRPPTQRQTLFELLRREQRRDVLRQQPVPAAPQRPVTPPAQQPRRGINENYARELMELHTLGVDGGYTQKDVQEVARCFTGWTIIQPRGGAAAANALAGDPTRKTAGTFLFNARAHDEGEKTVLGQKIPAGGGMKDGLMVLDILAHHPSTAKFIATKLTRHFVSDNPSPALVERVAAAFTKSDGDIRETLRAIFFSPEFNSPDNYRAKIKRPFELVVSAIRTLGAETNGGPGTHQWIQRMGEPLYGFQTPNGYSDTAESWVNTGGLLERMNFGLALASNRIPGTRVNLPRLNAAGLEPSPDKLKVMDQYLNTILGGDVSPATRETLLKQLDQPAVVKLPERPQAAAAEVKPGGEVVQTQPRPRPRGDASINDPVTKVVGLILGTPEFQRQ